jgi:flavin-dependent dehydrogenase
MDFSVEYDVAVVGGGVAGVAAALQSARSGMKTVLVEKTILLGGLATSGLVYIYLPLCDGMGHHVTRGISEELLKLSLKYGPGEIPDWRNACSAPESGRYICRFSPASFMLSLEELLLEENVDLWYDTLVCGAEMNGSRVTGIIVENES